MRDSLPVKSGVAGAVRVAGATGSGSLDMGSGTSLLLPHPALPCLLFTLSRSITGCCRQKPSVANRGNAGGRKHNYCGCELCCESESNWKVLFRQWRKAVPYKYLLMQIKSFVFSNVHFTFSLLIFSELPYVLLVIFQSCQIKKRKPYN